MSGRRSRSHAHTEDDFLSLEQRYLSQQKEYRAMEEELKLLKVQARKEGRRPATASQPSSPALASRSVNRPSTPGSTRARPPSAAPTPGKHSAAPTPRSSTAAESRAAPPAAAAVAVVPGASATAANASPPPEAPAPAPAAAVPGAVVSADAAVGGATGAAEEQPSPSSNIGQAINAVAATVVGGVGPPPTQPPAPHPTADPPVAGAAVPAGAAAPPFQSVGIPPDPMMVWGVDAPLLTSVKTQALLEVNKQLRDRITKSEQVIDEFEAELQRARATCQTLTQQSQQFRLERDQLMAEREFSVKRTASSDAALTSMREQLDVSSAKSEAARKTLELTCQELRGKLALSIDSNQILQKDLQTTTDEARIKGRDVASLQQRLTASESGLSAQRQVNETMLIELQSLSSDLATERKRVLTISRELELASEHRRRCTELETVLGALRQEKSSVEQENLRLLSEAVGFQERAARSARDVVEADLKEAQDGAAHWERMCRLQFQDIQQRTAQHIETRRELDAVKAQRDELQASTCRHEGELEHLRARLDAVWPDHAKDSAGLTAENVKRLFSQRTASRQALGLFPHSNADAMNASIDAAAVTPEHIAELHQANAALVAELETERVAKDLLMQQMDTQRGQLQRRDTDVAKAQRHAERTEALATKRVNAAAGRVSFLEDRVRSLHGEPVAADTSLMSLAQSENVLEMFLGHFVLGKSTTTAKVFWDDCPCVFLSVDFMLHETVTTDALVFTNDGFFDATLAYRVTEDSLLLHNLLRRKVSIDLRRVDGGEASTVVASAEQSFAALLRDASILESSRPAVNTHVDLTSPDGAVLGRLELCLTARQAFTPEFVEQCGDRKRKPQNDGAIPRIGAPDTASDTASELDTTVDSGRTDLVAVALGVTGISIEVARVKVDLAVSPCPLLAWWFRLVGTSDTTDTWVFPPTPMAQYNYTYGKTMTFQGITAADLFAALKAPLALIAFEEDAAESTQASEYWGVASLSLGTLLQARTMEADVPVLSQSGEHRGSLLVRASLLS